MSFCGTIEMIAAEHETRRIMDQLIIEVAMDYYRDMQLAKPYMGTTVGEAIAALQEGQDPA